MRLVFRVTASFVVVSVAYYFIFSVAWILLASLDKHGWIALAISLPCAAGVGWWVWKWSAQQGLTSSVLLGALALGGIGLYAGFFGPIIFKPEANQGPLLGIFITGPLGFLLGGFGGFLYWRIHEKKTGTIPKRPR